AIKPTRLWAIIPVAASSACDQLRMPRASTSADSASGQTPPRRSTSNPTPVRSSESSVEESAAFDQIRTGLRRLVVAEETFYAENGTYTEDFERLQYKPAPRNAVRLLWLSGSGRAASGTPEGVTGKHCVIYVRRDRG